MALRRIKYYNIKKIHLNTDTLGVLRITELSSLNKNILLTKAACESCSHKTKFSCLLKRNKLDRKETEIPKISSFK